MSQLKRIILQIAFNFRGYFLSIRVFLEEETLFWKLQIKKCHIYIGLEMICSPSYDQVIISILSPLLVTLYSPCESPSLNIAKHCMSILLPLQNSIRLNPFSFFPSRIYSFISVTLGTSALIRLRLDIFFHRGLTP